MSNKGNKGNVKIETSEETKTITDNAISNFTVLKTNQQQTYSIGLGPRWYPYQDIPEKFALVFGQSDMTDVEIEDLCDISTRNTPVDATITEYVADRKHTVFLKNVKCQVLRDRSEPFPEIVFFWTRQSSGECRES